jgi:hypothetical protein
MHGPADAPLPSPRDLVACALRAAAQALQTGRLSPAGSIGYASDAPSSDEPGMAGLV